MEEETRKGKAHDTASPSSTTAQRKKKSSNAETLALSLDLEKEDERSIKEEVLVENVFENRSRVVLKRANLKV